MVKNRFYTLAIPLQWVLSILILAVGFYPALLILELAYDAPLAYLLFLFYIPLGQFAIAPLLSLSGIYYYYSPLLLGYIPSSERIELHSGTSFDYLFVMTRFKPGIQCRTAILYFHIQGLLQIINLLEKKVIPESIQIEGSSYFFNHKSLLRLGFSIASASRFHQVNLFVNFIDIIWMYSLAMGRFKIPPIWKIQKAKIDGHGLLKQKEKLQQLSASLEKRLST